MAIELQQVLYALLLALAHLAVFAVAANLELGVRYTTGPRDEPPDLSKKCARLGRAYENYLETLPWFIAAVVVTHLAGKVDEVTIWAGWAYLGARVMYVPAYYSGVPLLRSIIWSVAAGAIFLIVIRALM